MEELRKENDELKKEIIELKQKLQKYANPSRAKKFYEENKERIAAIRSEKYYKKKEELNKKDKLV
jgi:hypothetical protein